MKSSSPVPANGSSRTTGGTLRGGQDKFNLADASEHRDEFIPVSTYARVYASSALPSSVDPSETASIPVRCKHVSQLRDLLPEVAKRYPLLKGEHLVYSSNLFL